MVDGDGEKAIGGHESGERDQHFAPGTARAEIEKAASDSGEVPPARMGQHARQDSNQQQQVSNHDHLVGMAPGTPARKRQSRK
jgi:hypothetical protein